jgi:prefoldin subunit 5
MGVLADRLRAQLSDLKQEIDKLQAMEKEFLSDVRKTISDFEEEIENDPIKE